MVHSFGRADELDRAELERLVRSINRVLDDGNDGAGSAATSDRPEIEIERVFELGVVLAARALWEELGIGPAIRQCAERAKLTAPHEIALFAMAANRLDDPVSKLAVPNAGFPTSPGFPTPPDWRSINAIVRSTFWQSRPTRLNVMCSLRQPICSASMLI